MPAKSELGRVRQVLITLLLPIVLPGNFILDILLILVGFDVTTAPQLAMWEKTRPMALVEGNERMSTAEQVVCSARGGLNMAWKNNKCFHL